MKWQSPGLGKSGLCFMFYNILEKEGASIFDTPSWTPSFRPVEVVLNGDYIGLYFLTETIRIDENRVNIYKQQDQETNPDLISGGWLVEVDNYRDECQITIPENNQWNLTLRYHSPENLSNAQLQWLTDEFKAINSTH